MKQIANRRLVNVCSVIVLLMACSAVMAQTKHNQIYIQPMAGTHVSWWHGEMGCYDEYTGKMVEFNSKGKMGYTVGLEVGYSLSQSFGLSLGTAYTRQTLCSDDVLWSEKHNEQEVCYIYNSGALFDLLSFPLLVNYNLYKGLSVKAGLQMGVKLKHDYTMTKETNGHVVLELEKGLERTDPVLDFSLPVGLSYDWKGMVVDLRYITGLSKIADSEIQTDYTKNYYNGFPIHKAHLRTGLLQLTLGYRFGL